LSIRVATQRRLGLAPDWARLPETPDVNFANLRAQTHGAECGVYFLQATVAPFLVKIGVGNAQRIDGIQSLSPVRLALLHFIPFPRRDAFTLEREVHYRLDHLRSYREWFLPGQDLLRFIREVAPQSAG
jgi:hypothetical protein